MDQCACRRGSGAGNRSSNFISYSKEAVSGTVVGEANSQKVAYVSGPSFGALRGGAPGLVGGEARGRHSGWLHRAIDLQWSLDRSSTVHYRSSRLGVHMAYHAMTGPSHRTDPRCLCLLAKRFSLIVVLGSVAASAPPLEQQNWVLRSLRSAPSSSRAHRSPLLSERHGSGSPEPQPSLRVEARRPSAAMLLAAASSGSQAGHPRNSIHKMHDTIVHPNHTTAHFVSGVGLARRSCRKR